jgi:hypothetical protein
VSIPLALVNRGGGRFESGKAVVSTPTELVGSASLVVLVKAVADTLERHYPGWGWCVKPDEGGGIIDITCIKISTRVGYTLHIANLQNDPTLARVVRAGGEYLERFGFRRVRYSYTEWKRREQTLGQFIPDVTDLSAAERRTFEAAKRREAVRTGHARIVTDDRIGAALKARTC